MNTNSGELTGKRLGNYQVHRRLGKGGMGEVYLAHDVPLDRAVALKVMRSNWAHEDGLVERFQREARAAAQLNHPNIVHIHAVGTEDGIPYFAMEYVEGTPLDALLKQHGPMPWQQTLNVVSQVTSALEAAHAKGIIHRDIKPANIIIDNQGRARVTDFGVAKVLTAKTQLTTDGSFIGTPQYMSPEHCGVGQVGPASDLFSLGATAYEMLTGSVPFTGDTPATLVRKITQESPPPLSELLVGVPESVIRFVHTMLDKDTSIRFKTAREALNELARIASGAQKLPETLSSPPTSPAHVPTKGKSFGLPIKGIGIAVGVVLWILGGAVIGARGVRGIQSAKPKSDANATREADSQPTMPTPQELFAAHDVNGNDLLEESELPVPLKAFLLRTDANNDKSLTIEELIAAKQRLNETDDNRTLRNRPVLRPDEIVRRYDSNKDGTILPSEVPAGDKSFFRMNDSNGDGKVTEQEIMDNRRLRRQQ